MTVKIIKRFNSRINSSTKNIKMEIVCSTDSKIYHADRYHVDLFV